MDADVIVAGLGAMGSAAAFHLARRGARVVGFDRFRPPHDRGSSHGLSRIIREAYFEHPAYVPLVRRAYELWDELERASERRLLLKTGGLMIGAPHSRVVQGALRSATDHGLPYELLTGGEVRQRHPALRPPDDMVAVFEPRAGILFPEACVEAHLDQAARAGAELRFDEPVLDWKVVRGNVRVRTARGETRARRLVVSAGAWAGELLADAGLPLRVERQVL
jgi:sarcosine oxidase